MEKPNLKINKQTIISKANADPVAIETIKNNIKRNISTLVLFSVFNNKKEKDKTEREDSILGFQIIPWYLSENKSGSTTKPIIITKAIIFIIMLLNAALYVS